VVAHNLEDAFLALTTDESQDEEATA
jgi:hypothetical protein